MSSLIEFPLEDGSSLWVEVSESTPPLPVRSTQQLVRSQCSAASFLRHNITSD